MVLGTYREVYKSFYRTGTYTTHERRTHTPYIHTHKSGGGKKKKKRET